jgi:hypothetical protein
LNTLQNTSLGYFKRESIEEVFVIMSGTGRMTVADQTFPVKQYDGRLIQIDACAARFGLAVLTSKSWLSPLLSCTQLCFAASEKAVGCSTTVAAI